MSNKIPVFLISLAVICLALPQQKVAEACSRPRRFKSTARLTEYINCLKELVGVQRYGRRSNQNPSVLVKSLQPRMYQDYEQRPEKDSQDFYDILKYEYDN